MIRIEGIFRDWYSLMMIMLYTFSVAGSFRRLSID